MQLAHAYQFEALTLWETIVDEARHLLASKHDALSDNIRLHRSKGLVVTLASQSPAVSGRLGVVAGIK